MTKPDWCPQWAWDAANMAVVHAPDYTQRLHEDVARALLDAHQRGRREGMEEAAPLFERLRSWIEDEVGAELPFAEAEQAKFDAIRAKMEEKT